MTIPEGIFFVETDKLILKLYRRSKIVKTLSKKNKDEELTLPDFKMYYKATVIKTV